MSSIGYGNIGRGGAGGIERPEGAGLSFVTGRSREERRDAGFTWGCAGCTGR